MSSQQEIQEEFEGLLKESSWWKRFIGSQFVSVLSAFIAQIIDRLERVATRALQESFLSLATKESSILAGAEDVGYVGLKISPSVGIATVTNTSSERLTLPLHTTVVSGSQMQYTLMQSIDLHPSESVDVDVEQIYLSIIEAEVTDESSWQGYELTKALTAQVHELKVYVDGELWAKSFKFRNTSSTSTVYMEYYKSTRQLGVRFGNGINGKIPELGSTIRLEAWCTDGESTLLDGQKLSLIGDNESLNSSFSIVTKTTVTGGAHAEDIETTRNGAMYTTQYDNEVVWNNDYEHYIGTNVGGIIWLSVWGEQEQERLTGVADLDNINTVFVSAYSDVKDEDSLGDEILTLLAAQDGYNEKQRYVPRVDLPYTVKVVGKVSQSYKPEDAETEIANQLSLTYGKDVNGKSHKPLKRDIWASIEEAATDLGITEYDVELTGIPDSVPVGHYSYLDIEASTFEFDYEDVN